jgi:uncharacterized protein YnzC (UPF0291/DUF896 family)
MEKLIERINELTAISRERELTKAEKAEREELRAEYLEIFRGNFIRELKSVKIVDENGNDITPIKLKEEKAKDKGGKK